MKLNFLPKILLFIAIFAVGMAVGQKYLAKTNRLAPIQAQKNTPKAFLSEVYDKIKENYWDNISDAQLIDLFKNASAALGNPLADDIKSKDELLGKLDQSQSAKLVSQVLSSLNPIGRSGLYTQKEQQQLENTVANINPQKDLYKDLELSKGATKEEVAQAYQRQAQELQKQSSPAAQEKLKEIVYAKDVLSKDDSKTRYDSGGVEPTIFTKTIGNTLYLQFKKFSPTSLDEFQKAFISYQSSNLDSLILDLRGNIGGAIDETAYFLGFFLGKGQSAFDFYHQGQYLPFKTQTDKLPSLTKYKQVVMLVDKQTQSSAEMLAASFKRFHLGVVLGSTTKGWGTVERVFPLDNQIDTSQKYSLFLVHSITLRDDNQPIEGRGVDPDINISNPNWQQSLYTYFRNPGLNSAVAQVISNPD